MVGNMVHLPEKPNVKIDKPEHMLKGSSITPYLLLIALSLHGFFEGIALGIQEEVVSGTLFLTFAIIAHKWAEAFTLVRFT